MITNKELKILPNGPIEREMKKSQIMIVKWKHPTWNPQKRHGNKKVFKR